MSKKLRIAILGCGEIAEEHVKAIKNSQRVELAGVMDVNPEASKDLGAGKWTTLMKVTIPLSLPGIFAGCMLTAVPTTGEFVVPAILGGGKVVVWGWLIYEEFTAGRNWPMGAALSNVLLLVMLIIIALYIKVVGTEDF